MVCQKVGKFLKLAIDSPRYLGGTPSRAVENFWQNGTIPWINSGKLNNLRITDQSEFITKEALEKSATK